MHIGGIRPKQNWLKKYGLRNDYIDFSLASKEISAYLLRDVNISLPTIKKSIFGDIIFRLSKIKIKREKELTWLKNDIIFNIWLGITEYFDKNPYGELSKTYYNFIYKFLKKNQVDKEKSEEMWKKAELERNKRDKKIKNDLVNFNQTINTAIIKNSEKFLKKSNFYRNTKELLNNYYYIDENLTKLEFYLDKISEEFDREVQREIDIRRGK